VLVNRAAEETAGRTRIELLGKTDEDFFDADRAAAYRDEDREVLAADHPMVFDGSYVTLSGQSRWVIRSKNSVQLADGSRVLLTALTDITERKTAESESRRAQQFLEGLINALPAAIFVKDQEHRWVLVNDAFAATTGQTRQALIGKSDHAVFPPARAKGNWIEDDEVRATKVPISTEEMLGDADGCEHWYLKTKSVITLSDATEYVVGIRTEITQRKRTESELLGRYSELTALNLKLSEANAQIHAARGRLVETEKLASIGQLAAGVAHEINNPIGYVFSNFGTLERYLADLMRLIDAYVAAEPSSDQSVSTAMSQLREEIDLDYIRTDAPSLMRESREGIERVRKIVQDLKDFSHVDASTDWQTVDLHRGLESTLNIVNNEIKYRADIVRRYGEIPAIQCLPSELNQVFMNLLMNAAHALEGGPRGIITVRTGCDDVFAWVEIADTGCGIPADKLSRIFDPFFTTKPVGKGTGLGLALSYGIVQKHHGRIEVTSQMGQGSTFRVVLPIRQADAEAAVT
ncbi:MAG: ATP-binding protein, partial [Betaproteobacteria bacterium]